MHYARSNKFKEQIEWILEFVDHPRLPDSQVHRSCQRAVRVRIKQEPRGATCSKCGEMRAIQFLRQPF